MTDNADLARRLHEAWNERNFDEIAEATAPDGTITIVGSGDTFEGPDGSGKTLQASRLAAACAGRFTSTFRKRRSPPSSSPSIASRCATDSSRSPC